MMFFFIFDNWRAREYQEKEIPNKFQPKIVTLFHSQFLVLNLIASLASMTSNTALLNVVKIISFLMTIKMSYEQSLAVKVKPVFFPPKFIALEITFSLDYVVF